MTGPSAYVERKVAEMLAILAPAPDGATWRCGHPKTPANTQAVGKGRVRCRICRRRTAREAIFRARHPEGV